MAKFSTRSKTTPVASCDEVQAELHRLEQERASTIAEHLRLADTREAVLLEGSDADLLAHDEAVAATRLRAERAALRHERLLPELDEAPGAEEQPRRCAVYDDAKQAHDDGLAAMGEYQAAAEARANIARRICAANVAAIAANRELPEGAEPLDPPERFNGTAAASAEYADETRIVAVDRRTGKVVNGYSPDDPTILRLLEPTGRRVVLNLASPARPHQSFLHGLRVPGRDPGSTLV